MAKLPPVLAWSYSRYADYKQCPAKFMYKHLMKLPDPGGPAMQRGNVIHKLAEDYVKGKLRTVPPELKGVTAELKFLKAQNATAEEAWGFTQHWEWINRPGWFGDDVWFRAKTDVRLLYDDGELLLGDWKTGKKYFSNEEQIELFALAGYMRFPDVNKVDTRLWYTDAPIDDNEIQREYTASDMKKIKGDWARKVVPMFKDRKYAPTPNDKCGWCPFTKAKGGPCKF